MPAPAEGRCKCTHTRKEHCTAGTSHSYYKDEMRQTRTPRSIKCKSDHCLAPLCDCTHYRHADQT